MFHLESLSDGRAKLNLSFCLPPPSEIIPPPPPLFPTSTFTPSHPATSTKRPIIPLFFKPPTPKLSSKQRKSYLRLAIHWASRHFACNVCAAVTADKTITIKEAPRSSSQNSLPLRLWQDFSLPESEEESSGSSQGFENLRGASLPRSPQTLSLDPTFLVQRDALLSPLNLEREVQEEDTTEKRSEIEEKDLF